MADLVTITDDAVQYIRAQIKLMTGSTENSIDGWRFRIYIEGGGCAGFMYNMMFDKQLKEGDNVQKFDDVEIVIDAMSAMYLQGAKIEYYSTPQMNRLVINNPNTTGGCGCGNSFST